MHQILMDIDGWNVVIGWLSALLSGSNIHALKNECEGDDDVLISFIIYCQYSPIINVGLIIKLKYVFIFSIQSEFAIGQ